MVYDVTPVVSGPELFVSFNVTYGVVQQLTPNYTAVEPAYEVTDLTNTEAWDIWYRDGWWYLSVSLAESYRFTHPNSCHSSVGSAVIAIPQIPRTSKAEAHLGRGTTRVAST